MSTDEATHGGTEEVTRGGQRVIVVNSQPSGSTDELPPRRMKSLGAVSAHATDPMSSDTRPRRSAAGGRRGRPALAIVLMALPIAVAAYVITLLTDRTTILAATGVLALVWLLGIVAAWRGLGPRGRDSRGGVWLGRAIGLVVGFIVAVYVLFDTVSPLL